MKKILSFIILIISLSACDEPLENVEPESSLTFKNFWASPSSAESAVVGLHDDFRSNDFWYFLMGDLRSEIWGGNTLATPHATNIIQNDIRVSYGAQAPDKITTFYGSWIDTYTFIHRVNDAIINIPDIEFDDQAMKDYLLGQVYGMRAYAYYWLLKTYGPVPIVKEPTTSIDKDEVARARSPKDEVMSLIKNDISQSLDHFGDDNSFYQDNRTFWSKAATLMLKGQVYIWSGVHHGGGDSDFTEAKQALNSVITMGHFDLQDDFLSLFNQEQNQEIIFAMDYEEAEAENIFSPMCITFEDHFVDSTGDPVQYNGVYWVQRYAPSDYLRQKFYARPNDQRGETFRFIYTMEEGEPVYYASHLRKFDGTYRVDGNVMDDDVPIYRYAETLLLLAEAKNHLGEDISEEINAIRERAYGEDYDPAVHGYTNGTQEENTEAILQENLLEFIGEGKRWWALRRAGDQWVFDKHPYLEQDEAYTFYLPISRDVLGRNPKLEQTQGYN
jgi:hypothetical protein